MPRRYYTPELANRSLPLVRSIATDVRDTALEMERLLGDVQGASPGELSRDDLADRIREIQSRFGGLLAELAQLGVELKNPFQGLLDFRAERGGRDVFLCWKLGEDAVGHWHEIEAGFAGRQPIDTF